MIPVSSKLTGIAFYSTRKSVFSCRNGFIQRKHLLEGVRSSHNCGEKKNIKSEKTSGCVFSKLDGLILQFYYEVLIGQSEQR